ncbi:hypothetical protein ACWD01_36210 [Streptomyces sp. NPDC002835]|jgi:hypothetical protein
MVIEEVGKAKGHRLSFLVLGHEQFAQNAHRIQRVVSSASEPVYTGPRSPHPIRPADR